MPDIDRNQSDNWLVTNEMNAGRILAHGGGTHTSKFNVDNGGLTTSIKYRVSALNTAPTSTSDTGIVGEIRFATDGIYLCISTNTWVKATVSSF